jgi:hypothetical protein
MQVPDWSAASGAQDEWTAVLRRRLKAVDVAPLATHHDSPRSVYSSSKGAGLDGVHGVSYLVGNPWDDIPLLDDVKTSPAGSV